MVQGNPASISEAERADIGIGTKLPTTIEQSLEALEGNTSLREALGPHVVAHFVAMKKSEQEKLNVMSENERRVWLLERY